jgi:hypothetical protein
VNETVLLEWIVVVTLQNTKGRFYFLKTLAISYDISIPI